MIKDIDQNEWTKLLNRRVQHYGYEFKYGTNDVDFSDPMKGKMPEFTQFLLPSKLLLFMFYRFYYRT